MQKNIGKQLKQLSFDATMYVN